MTKTAPKNRSSASPKTGGGPATPGGGKSTAELIRQANRYRDNYNPLRGLVISKVVALLEASERGDYAELMLTVRKIEKRYPILKALKSRRLAALEKLDWDIKIVSELPEGCSEADAEAQRKHLRSRYELVTNLTESFGKLVEAEFRGYSILQKHRLNEGGANDGAVNEFHWLPQYCFSRDGQFGDFYYNKDSQFGIGQDACKTSLGETNRIGGDDFPREDFIMREVEAPLYEIALVAFVNWAMGRKDWAAFVEIFGLPNSIVIMPPNIPNGKEDEYRSAAEKVADGVSGALPNGSDAKFPTDSVRGNSPFKEFCDANNEDVVLAGTSGLLTMLSMPQGIGSGSSEQHGDAFDDLAQADARKINETLQRDFDKIELAAQFPGKPCLAYFELSAIEEEDATAVVTNVVALEGTGLQTDAEEVSEKTGLKLTRVAKPAAPGFGFGGAPGTAPAGARTAESAAPEEDEEELDAEGNPITNRAAPTADLRPPPAAFASAIQSKVDLAGALVQRITEIKDDALMLAELQKFLDNAPIIERLITADVSAAARALEQITAPAFAAGLQGKQPS